MEEYTFIVMSIDPMEDEDDNSQKYVKSAYGNSEKEAEQKVMEDFKLKNLPVYWIEKV